MTNTESNPSTTTTIALTVAQYADAHQLSIRTVRRYLAAGRLPGVSQLPSGEWMIPADAAPTLEPVAQLERHQPTTDVNPWEPQTFTGELVSTGSVIEAALDALPTGFVSLEDASTVLGISTRAIRRHRDYFGAVPFGPNGALVVPQSTLRTIAGL